MPFSHSGMVSLYPSEPKEPTQFGSVSGSEIQNICNGRNPASWHLFRFFKGGFRFLELYLGLELSCVSRNWIN